MASDTTPATIPLPARLDTDAAGALRETLLAVRGGPVEIDAGDVRRVGALSLTVLASAWKTWVADGQSLTLTNPNDDFTAGCRRLGFEPQTFGQEATS